MRTSRPHPTRTPVPGSTGSGHEPGLCPLGLFTLLIGTFLPMTDFFIVNVALPTINANLHTSSGVVQLVVAGYAVAYAVLLVVGGRLGDSFGRRRLFTIGTAGFAITSLACGLAPTPGALVAARVLQGSAAALMLPQVLSTIQATTSGHRRARALGLYGATGGMAVVAGQLLGGALIAANIAGTTWRPIFLVNVPVGLVGVLLASRAIPETRSATPAPVDVAGTALLGVTLLALLIPLTEGRALNWPAWSIAALAASPLTAWAFVRAERRLEDRGGMPLVPMSVLAIPSMRQGLALGIPFFGGFGGFMFVYVLTLQDSARFTPLETGLTLVPMAMGFLAASLSMARLVTRFGRSVLTAGAGIQALGLTGVALAVQRGWPHPSPWALGAATLGLGIGQGLVMTPLFRVVLSEVPENLAGVGSGVLATMQQTALGFGVASLGGFYLDESPVDRLGALHSALIVLVVLVAVAGTVSVLTRTLPAEPVPVPSATTSATSSSLDALTADRV